MEDSQGTTAIYLTIPFFFKTLKFPLLSGHTLAVYFMVAGVPKHYIIYLYILWFLLGLKWCVYFNLHCIYGRPLLEVNKGYCL